MRRVILGTAAVLAAAVFVHAQATLTGTWEGATPGGLPLVLEVTATETTLAGTLRRGTQSLPLADGKVSKNTFTFKVTLPPNNTIQTFSGELNQHQITLWADALGPSTAAVLKRVEN